MAGTRCSLRPAPAQAAPASPHRRRLLAAAAAWGGLAASGARAQGSSVIRLAQTTALSGPLAELGQASHLGAKACFAAINARGGINGAAIELVAKDDGYDAKRAVENIQGFLDDPAFFALFNCLGTPIVEASLPMVRSSGIPFFAPYTGALLARPKDLRNVFNVRASYPDEAEQLVQHLTTIGMRRIAVIYQNNAFGKEVFAGAQAALAKRKLEAVASATVENDASDAEAAARKILGGAPEATILGLAGKPTAATIKSLRTLKRGLPLYALSVMGSTATLNALGDDAIGVTVSQIVPLPTNPALGITREFAQAWQALGASLPPSHTALEGYINARVFAEGLRRAGRNPSRAAFIDSVWSIRQWDLGGYMINFTEPGTSASSFIELTMIGRGGKFIR